MGAARPLQEKQRLLEAGQIHGGARHTRAFGGCGGTIWEPHVREFTLTQTSILVLATGGAFETMNDGAFALDPEVYKNVHFYAMPRRFADAAIEDGAMDSITVLALQLVPQDTYA